MVSIISGQPSYIGLCFDSKHRLKRRTSPVVTYAILFSNSRFLNTITKGLKFNFHCYFHQCNFYGNQKKKENNMRFIYAAGNEIINVQHLGVESKVQRIAEVCLVPKRLINGSYYRKRLDKYITLNAGSTELFVIYVLPVPFCQ